MVRDAWVLVAGLLLASCARRPAAGSVAPQPADSVTVNIINHCTEPVVIFAEVSGQDYRIGRADPATPSQFVLRAGWLWGRSVELVAESSCATRGSGAVRSGHLDLRPGDVIEWDITTGSSRAVVRH
jgi:hypothetical protein